MKDFKIRASGASQIMGVKGLGKTGQTYCHDWLIEQTFNRRKEFSNKYTEKGLIVEDDSIDLVADTLGYGLLIKNEQFYQNDFMTGTPDLVLKDEVIDIKSSWDVFTFPFFEDKLPKAYYLQGQVYMELTGIKKYKVIYVLTDTPAHLIEREARSYSFKQGATELDMDTYKDFEKKMTFSDIPAKSRIKEYSFEYDEAVVQSIKDRVIECREFIKNKQKTI